MVHHRPLALSLICVLAAACLACAQVDQKSTGREDTGSESTGSESMGSSDPNSSASGPRQLFAVLGIDQQRLQQLTDRTGLEATEQEILVRILRRLNRFGDEAISRWRHDQVPWQTLAEDPAPHRLEIFSLAGRIVDVRAYPLSAELARRFEFSEVYQLSLRVDGLESSVTLFSVSVPRRWRAQLAAQPPAASQLSARGGPTSADSFAWDENVRLSAWFVKLDSPRQGRPSFLFATPRIQWFPDRLNPDLGIAADQLMLAAQGVDLSRLDEVRDEKGLGVHDREAFYQLLAATTAESELPPVTRSVTTSLQQLFADPKTQRGNRYTFRGVARRAVKIQVEDPDIRRKYGIDHYYELELFVGLDQSIRVLSSQDDPTGKLFHAYPIAYCTRQIPATMPVGEIIQEEVEVTGHFLKLWAYSTPYMDESNTEDATRDTATATAAAAATTAADRRRRRKQVSPLLIGPQPVWYPSEVTPARSWGWRGTAAAVVGLGILYWGVWRLASGDRQLRQAARQRRYQLPPGKPLDDLPEVPDGPDFSGLG